MHTITKDLSFLALIQHNNLADYIFTKKKTPPKSGIFMTGKT